MPKTKLSMLITRLQNAQAKYGDLDIELEVRDNREHTDRGVALSAIIMNGDQDVDVTV